GRIRRLLEELGLADRTLIIFTSDNGPTFNGGTDSEFFNSAGPLRGLKTQLYEGGIRVPLIAWWPERIEAGRTSDHVSAFWDFLPTFAELTGTEVPVEVDGRSLLPILLGRPGEQVPHEYLYWEYHGRQAVRLGDWKGYRASVDDAIELYDLATDIGELRNVADLHPDVVAWIAEIMQSGRTESQLFPLVRSPR
ncbi:MAG: sulfatase-like hydrolase/transferase, partial [Gemmatimonadales bacterium]